MAKATNTSRTAAPSASSLAATRRAISTDVGRLQQQAERALPQTLRSLSTGRRFSGELAVSLATEFVNRARAGDEHPADVKACIADVKAVLSGKHGAHAEKCFRAELFNRLTTSPRLENAD